MYRRKLIPILGFVLASSSGACAIEPKDQKLMEDSSQPAKIASRDWTGEAITIRNEGISPSGDVGGVEVNVSREAKRVSVEAVFAAYADNDLQHHAAHAIQDAITTFALDETDTSVDIKCGHGQTYGTARAIGSGCRTLRVTIPAGSADRPHELTIFSGSGWVVIGGDQPVDVRRVVVDSRGPSSVETALRPVAGAVVQLTARFTVTVSLPSDFSAKKVSFALSDPAEAHPRGVATEFPLMVNNAAYPVEGPTARAAEVLLIASSGPLDTDLINVRRLVPELAPQ